VKLADARKRFDKTESAPAPTPAPAPASPNPFTLTTSTTTPGEGGTTSVVLLFRCSSKLVTLAKNDAKLGDALRASLQVATAEAHPGAEVISFAWALRPQDRDLDFEVRAIVRPF